MTLRSEGNAAEEGHNPRTTSVITREKRFFMTIANVYLLLKGLKEQNWLGINLLHFYSVFLTKLLQLKNASERSHVLFENVLV